MAKRFSDPNADLVQKVQSTGDNDAMKQIIENVSGIYLQKVERTLPDNFPEKKEMIEDRTYKIFEYVQSYNPEKKMKLSTYVGQRAMWECYNIYNRSKRVEELTEGLDCSYEQEFDNCDDEILREIFLLAENYPDERARTILEHRFNGEKPKSWKEIALAMNLHTATVINIQKKFLNMAKKSLKRYE